MPEISLHIHTKDMECPGCFREGLEAGLARHQWQPIETAKPYINLLLLTEDGVVEGYYHEHNEFRDGGWYATLPSWNDHWQCFPSAWMPPPPLPEGRE